MERKEEIFNAAEYFANAVSNGIQDSYFDIVLKTYQEGANWSDKHPRKDLIEFNKVYIWLTDFLSNHYIEENSTGNEINSDYVLAEFMQWKNKV